MLIAGSIIITICFAVVIGMTFLIEGWRFALFAWSTAFALTGLLVLGMVLVETGLHQ